jgi:hypothetical protein
MKKIILASLFLYSSLSFSNCKPTNEHVIFFDFNDSPEEIEGAKQSAESKCQTFHAFKSEDEAKVALKKIEDSGDKIDSMILSGHHKFGIFWGKNFHFTIGGMSDFLDNYPKAKASLKNLYLWGCYTNNVDKLERWLKSFPNLNYVFGYTHKAPLSNQITGVEYLKLAMEHQNDLEKIDSLEKVKLYLDKLIPGSSANYHYVSAAIYGRNFCNQSNYKDYYYAIDQIEGGTKSSIDRFSDRGQCNDAASQFKKSYMDVVEAYWSGEKEMMSLSAQGSKDPKINPIRMDFYPWANKFAYCFKDSLFNVGKDSQIGLGQTLNLIYFQNIKENFFEYFKKDIEAAKADLKDSDLVSKLSKGKELTRKEIIDLNNSLDKATPKNKSITDLNFKIKKFLVNLDDRCADVNWLEDVTEIKTPPKFCTSPID